MSRRKGAATPDDLLLRTWELVHRARSFPAVQDPLMTALQEIAKVLRPAAKPEQGPEPIVKADAARDLLLV
jgi:hypothetical protein